MKDQDIVNAMGLVQGCRDRFSELRADGWDSLFEDVCDFCQEHSIVVPKMDDLFIRFDSRGRPLRNAPELKTLHHYRVDLFYVVIDLQEQELNDRFTEVSTELLLCIACLSPQDSFSAFNNERLLKLASFYPQDFSRFDVLVLKDQLHNYIVDMRLNDLFRELKGLGDLAQKLVHTKNTGCFL